MHYMGRDRVVRCSTNDIEQPLQQRTSARRRGDELEVLSKVGGNRTCSESGTWRSGGMGKGSLGQEG